MEAWLGWGEMEAVVHQGWVLRDDIRHTVVRLQEDREKERKREGGEERGRREGGEREREIGRAHV